MTYCTFDFDVLCFLKLYFEMLLHSVLNCTIIYVYYYYPISDCNVAKMEISFSVSDKIEEAQKELKDPKVGHKGMIHHIK